MSLKDYSVDDSADIANLFGSYFKPLYRYSKNPIDISFKDITSNFNDFNHIDFFLSDIFQVFKVLNLKLPLVLMEELQLFYMFTNIFFLFLFISYYFYYLRYPYLLVLFLIPIQSRAICFQFNC